MPGDMPCMAGGPPIALRAVIIIGTAAAVAFARTGARLTIVYPTLAVQATPNSAKLLNEQEEHSNEKDMALVPYDQATATMETEAIPPQVEEATNVVKEVLKSIGIERIDVFAKNAAIGIMKSTIAISSAWIQNSFDVDLSDPISAIRTIVPMIIALRQEHQQRLVESGQDMSFKPRRMRRSRMRE